MANSSAKKIARSNEKGLKQILIVILVATFANLLLRLYLFAAEDEGNLPWLLFLASACAEAGIYYMLYSGGRSTYTPDGRLLRCGDDIRTGLYENLFDISYLLAFAQATCFLTDWVWLILALIPLYGGYKIMPYARMFLGK